MNDKRNWKIYYEWIDGKEYGQLALEFSLSKETIKTICTDKVPDKIKQLPWQRANSYKKWREFLKRQRSAGFEAKQYNAKNQGT